MKKFFCILLISVLFVVSAFAESEQTYGIPIDIDSVGSEPDPAGYTDDWTYSDPTISVSITSGREGKCDYWIADITIADPSQLRTMAAGGFDSNAVTTGPSLSSRVNAVLAIDGDYFCYTGSGYIVRQGVEYKNILNGDRDVLAIDENGDFHVYYKAAQGDVGPEIDGKKNINTFYFGPVLIDNGVRVENPTGLNMASDEGRQRMALCQVGPLHYKAVCCAGPARGSYGMTLTEFSAFLETLGVNIAYNLDGGDSTMMIFRHKKINDVQNNSTRKISDIIYFASAIGMSAGE